MGDSITNSDQANQKDITADWAYPAITPIPCSPILTSFMHTKRTDWERTDGGVVRGDQEATRQDPTSCDAAIVWPGMTYPVQWRGAHGGDKRW
jgi:hypothetical protein